MIENFNDYISAGILLILVLIALGVTIRVFVMQRRQRLIDEEIEYYQEW